MNAIEQARSKAAAALAEATALDDKARALQAAEDSRRWQEARRRDAEERAAAERAELEANARLGLGATCGCERGPLTAALDAGPGDPKYDEAIRRGTFMRAWLLACGSAQ